MQDGASVWNRVRGIRANASRLSHAELNDRPTVDDGVPHELADDYARLRAALPRITVLGGCCGTDERHIEAIARACGFEKKSHALSGMFLG
jgi:homocysteine S-methyltransferase